MEALGLLFHGFAVLFTWKILALMMVGLVLGIFVGVLPGLGGPNGVAILLPLTFTMDPTSAIVMLSCIYWGALFGGAITSILFNIPGEAWSVATTFDGYPMAQQGKAGEALGLAVTSSSFGTIFSAIVMLVASPMLAQAALSFQSAEYFGLGLIGLSCITSIGAKNQTKAVVSVMIGLMIGTIGIDSINGVERFAFEQPSLLNGINYISVMIGAFAVAEVYKNIEEFRHVDTSLRTEQKVKIKLMKFSEMAKMWSSFIRGSVIGTIIGIIPAAGGSIASLIAYGSEAQNENAKPKFGEGNPRGIIAPECSHNAAVGGSMVPTLTLGIPGSPVAAVIMAAFLIIGLTPGPMLLREQPIMLNAIFLALITAALLLFVGGRFVTSQFGHILKLPYPLLGSLIVTLGVVGAYSLKNSFYDVLIMFAFGLVGYFFDKFKYSNAAVILGLILGEIIENSLRKQIIIGDGSGMGFLTRPVSVLVLTVAALTFLWPMISRQLKRGKA